MEKAPNLPWPSPTMKDILMPKILKLLAGAVGGLATLGIVGTGSLFVAARTVGVPAGLGVRDGRLAPCPTTPNCVSTQADPSDRGHHMEPVSYDGPAGPAIVRIAEIIAAEPRSEILVAEGPYLHAVFRSATMRFPDDVEFYVDESAGLIHFRSAARLGQGDAGVNRRRMEGLSAALEGVLR
jgi:uncharacterized protein (DUF1499 family)